MTERNASRIIPLYCHLLVSYRSLVDRCGSLGSCNSQIFYNYNEDDNIIPSNIEELDVSGIFNMKLFEISLESNCFVGKLADVEGFSIIIFKI